MKKIYQNPETTVLHIALQQMIAASDSLGFGDNVSTAAGADSRRHADIWGDEEEEE